MMSPVGTHALAREYHGEFVVLKNSTARMQGVASWTSYRQLRDELVRDQRLAPSGDVSTLVFTEDVSFNSPSAAAAVIFAGNQNGLIAWKVKDTGQTYKDWKETELQRMQGTSGPEV